MIKKTTFLKTLFVAAGLLVGTSNVWADATLVYGRALTASGDYTAWNAENDIKEGEWVASKGTASLDAERGLKVAQQRGSALASKSISVKDDAILTIDAEWNTGYSSGGAGENNAFTIGNNIEVRAYTYDQKGYVYINGAEYAAISDACGKNNGNREHDLWTIHIVVNTASNTITEFTIAGANGTKKASYTLDGTINLDATSTYNTISLAHNRTKGNNAAEATYLKSILIKEEVKEVSKVDYTVKFQDTAGNTLKDDVTYTSGAVVGALYTATSTDMATFYNDGNTKKYVYKSGQNTSTMATATASENVITLVFNTYEKFAYSLKYKLGAADAVEQSTAEIWEDETATVYYPVCRQDGENYYVIAKNESEPYFGKVMSSSNKDITVNYTLDEDIVYYKESEDMAGSRFNYAQVAAKTSNGSSYCSAASEGSYIATDWSVAAGNYNIEVGFAGRKASTPAPKLMTSAEDASPVALANVSVAENGINTKTYYNQEIATGQNLYVFNDNGGNASMWALDYVILRKVPSTLAVTIKTTGTTFSSAYAIDCSKLPDGVKAYKVASINKTEKKAVLAEVTEAVKAETGLILIAETAGTFNIPVAATGTDISSTNLLQAAVTATPVTADQAYGLSEGKFKKLNAGSVPAGKAYLLASDITNAPELDIDFGGTTAITNTNSAKDTNIREVYNLNGQRVAQPTKGLYIVNGKKVVIK